MIEGPLHASLESLLVAAGHGDLQAFDDLFVRMAPRVHGLALRIIRDAHLAEEVSQEVFIQVWQRSGAFDPARGSALAWVMTLAHRRAVDRVRSTAAGRRRDATHADDLSRWLPYDETATRALASVEAESLHAALATLSQDQRRAIQLAYFGGHTHREISDVLQCPPGTAKGRIRDGLARLRDALVVSVPEPA